MKLFKKSLIAALGLALSLGTATAAVPAAQARNVIARVHDRDACAHHDLRDGKLTIRHMHGLHPGKRPMLQGARKDGRVTGLSGPQQHAFNFGSDGAGKRVR